MTELYEVIDPRPVAACAKYTFFLPLRERLDALGVGDLVQLIIRSIPPSAKWDAERLWIRVTSVDPDWIEGTLESTPSDMPLVPKGMSIRARQTHVINIVFDNPEQEQKLEPDPRREFWDRCLVDQAILDSDLAVHYLYRETPDPSRGDDRFPDSGWRIRGDMRTASDLDLDNREVAYVALGAVLNKDDTWVHLIDAEIGTAYERDFDSNVYVRVDLAN